MSSSTDCASSETAILPTPEHSIDAEVDSTPRRPIDHHIQYFRKYKNPNHWGYTSWSEYFSTGDGAATSTPDHVHDESCWFQQLVSILRGEHDDLRSHKQFKRIQEILASSDVELITVAGSPPTRRKKVKQQADIEPEFDFDSDDQHLPKSGRPLGSHLSSIYTMTDIPHLAREVSRGIVVFDMKYRSRTAAKYSIPEEDINHLLAHFPQSPCVDSQFDAILEAFKPFENRKDLYCEITPSKRPEWDEKMYHYIASNFCHFFINRENLLSQMKSTNEGWLDSNIYAPLIDSLIMSFSDGDNFVLDRKEVRPVGISSGSFDGILRVQTGTYGRTDVAFLENKKASRAPYRDEDGSTSDRSKIIHAIHESLLRLESFNVNKISVAGIQTIGTKLRIIRGKRVYKNYTFMIEGELALDLRHTTSLYQSLASILPTLWRLAVLLKSESKTLVDRNSPFTFF